MRYIPSVLKPMSLLAITGALKNGTLPGLTIFIYRAHVMLPIVTRQYCYPHYFYEKQKLRQSAKSL